MHMTKAVASIFLSAICVCCTMFIASAAFAQFKIDFKVCEDLNVTRTSYGINVVETAACVNPASTLKPKGTVRNVHVLATFPAVPTGAGVTFMVTKNDANGEYVQNIDYAVSPRHTTAYAQLTLNTPGNYFVRMANYYDKTQVWATATFAIAEDTVGPRASGNTPSGQGKVSICREIDDSWRCVGESSEWRANVPFNINFENPTPSGVDFIGIMFYRQGADGRDAAFVNEYQQNIGEKNRRYATVGSSLRLPAGVYSVYVISWDKRQATERSGNLTEYFAKTTLTVK